MEMEIKIKYWEEEDEEVGLETKSTPPSSSSTRRGVGRSDPGFQYLDIKTFYLEIPQMTDFVHEMEWASLGPVLFCAWDEISNNPYSDYQF